MGARFAAGGGREGWIRTALTAVGVGLGVAVLLLAAAVPAMMSARDHREAARNTFAPGDQPKPSASTFLLHEARDSWHGRALTGVLLHPDGPAMKPPPGVAEVPPDGRMVVSPALKKLLAHEPLLRERIPYAVAGTIGSAGLTGPSDLYYYATTDKLVAYDSGWRHGNARRMTGFGQDANHESQGPVFVLLLVMVVVVLLLPIAVFVAAAVRLGGERRDRRLAALRLVGCDIGGTHRIAAGEALLGTVLGVLLGGLFFLVGRRFAADIDFRGTSAFPSDLTPDARLTVLIALAVPAAAVAVTVLSLRRTVIEPLGVFRQGLGRRRRVWWRIALPALGLALLAPQFGEVKGDAQLNEYQTAAGAVLLLVGVTAVLPWAVEAAVRRLRGGPVAWQLAIRRLQLGGGSAGRMVSGVTIAVAGAIALQMLFHGVDQDFTTSTGADPNQAQIEVSSSGGLARTAQEARQLAATKGVAEVTGYTEVTANRPDASTLSGDALRETSIPVVVADCTALRRLAAVRGCGPGSVYVVPPTGDWSVGTGADTYLKAGGRLDLNSDYDDRYEGTPQLWTIPRDAPTAAPLKDPTGGQTWGVFATPEAVAGHELPSADTRLYVRVDERTPDAREYVRTAAAGFGVDTYTNDIVWTTSSASYGQLRRGLFAGAAITLALIGASLLVSMLEQLRDRRKLLAVLVAFGTKRQALAWSVLWQTAVPVVLGLLLAAVGGVGLGAALLAMAARPFTMDWASVASLSAIGAAVVLGVTLLSMPVLWRLMRAEGLRTE
jgi:ABC-type lipoprotein release transport system permease subunit